jgi:RNA polymerase sigma-70 factor (sigma-E family)
MATDAQGGGRELGLPDEPGVALRAIYELHFRRLVGLASLLVDEDGAAEEVVQEAFVQTLLRWDSIRDRESPLGYVRQVVINGARGRLRRARTTRSADWRSQPRTVPAPDGAVVAEALETRATVLAALGRVPRRQRECIVLRFYGECSVTETADALGISEGAVKAHVHRGLAHLREHLEELR